MADINVERKGPSIWPWIVGLLVLALLIWAIAEMVDRGDGEMDTVAEREETGVVPPAVPAPGAAAGQVRSYEELAPLGPEDRGEVVTISGVVMGQRASDGFWLRAANGDVIYIVSERTVQPDQQLRVQGVVEQSQPDQATQRAEQAQLRQHPQFDQGRVRVEVHVNESASPVQPRP